MNPEEYTRILTGIISVLLSGGLILALVAWRKQRKQEPIDAETTAVVNARTAGELALAVAKQQEAPTMATSSSDSHAQRSPAEPYPSWNAPSTSNGSDNSRELVR